MFASAAFLPVIVASDSVALNASTAGGPAALVVALLALTAMEIVLGIDNVIFIAILAGRLPAKQQPRARTLGLAVALITRLLLLFTLTWLMGLDQVAVFRFTWIGLSEDWVGSEFNVITVKDLVLLVGGLFLIAKSTIEIHHKLEGEDASEQVSAPASFTSTIIQIALLDIVFSLDSVVTAVGMVRTIWVMVVAMILAMLVMLIFAGKVSDFVARHPTVKMLALAFLILIGVMLVADGLGQHIPKGYIYFAMAFSISVELLNMKVRAKSIPVALHEPHLPPS